MNARFIPRVPWWTWESAVARLSLKCAFSRPMIATNSTSAMGWRRAGRSRPPTRPQRIADFAQRTGDDRMRVADGTAIVRKFPGNERTPPPDTRQYSASPLCRGGGSTLCFVMSDDMRRSVNEQEISIVTVHHDARRRALPAATCGLGQQPGVPMPRLDPRAEEDRLDWQENHRPRPARRGAAKWGRWWHLLRIAAFQGGA